MDTKRRHADANSRLSRVLRLQAPRQSLTRVRPNLMP
jgi:hypothetical protein